MVANKGQKDDKENNKFPLWLDREYLDRTIHRHSISIALAVQGILYRHPNSMHFEAGLSYVRDGNIMKVFYLSLVPVSPAFVYFSRQYRITIYDFRHFFMWFIPIERHVNPGFRLDTRKWGVFDTIHFKISPIVEMTKVVGWCGTHPLCHPDRRRALIYWCEVWRIQSVIIVTGSENLRQWGDRNIMTRQKGCLQITDRPRNGSGD